MGLFWHEVLTALAKTGLGFRQDKTHLLNFCIIFLTHCCFSFRAWANVVRPTHAATARAPSPTWKDTARRPKQQEKKDNKRKKTQQTAEHIVRKHRTKFSTHTPTQLLFLVFIQKTACLSEERGKTPPSTREKEEQQIWSCDSNPVVFLYKGEDLSLSKLKDRL